MKKLNTGMVKQLGRVLNPNRRDNKAVEFADLTFQLKKNERVVVLLNNFERTDAYAVSGHTQGDSGDYVNTMQPYMNGQYLYYACLALTLQNIDACAGEVSEQENGISIGGNRIG